MPANRRRRAAALAAYLAQFASVGDAKGRPKDSLYAGLSQNELLQRHQDYLQALIWRRRLPSPTTTTTALSTT